MNTPLLMFTCFSIYLFDSSQITGVSFSGDGRYLAVFSDDPFIMIVSSLKLFPIDAVSLELELCILRSLSFAVICIALLLFNDS